jgi:AcrR family transcriptional regulator
MLPGSLYHHFPSKEEIAVDLLTSYNQALIDLGRKAVKRLSDPTVRPEDLVRLLVRDVLSLSFEHAAAGRLRAYEAPTVAKERFSDALAVQSTALTRTWQRTVATLDTPPGTLHVDLGLLRFTLQRLTSDSIGYYTSDIPTHQLADHLCDLLFEGLAMDCPPDTELASSAAHRAARESLRSWELAERDGLIGDRAAIVAAARALFARRGYSATTIRDVAHAAGTPMATLYRRVESKEVLLREIVGAHTSRLDQLVGAVAASGATEVEMVDALAEAYVTVSHRFSQETRIVTFGLSGREAGTAALADYYRAAKYRLETLEQIVGQGIRNGSLRPAGSPLETALHVRAALWIPYHEYGRSSARRAHAFLRECLLRGALRGGH